MRLISLVACPCAQHILLKELAAETKAAWGTNGNHLGYHADALQMHTIKINPMQQESVSDSVLHERMRAVTQPVTFRRALCALRRADKTGQTALHWASVRGSLLAGEALLSHGADLRLQDGRGYTACHVAAQYGQTAFIYMCALRWRADIDRCALQGKQAAG